MDDTFKYTELKHVGGTNLLPCPFCGGEATVTGGSPFQPITTVWCDVCHSRGNPDTNPAIAIAAWNTRAAPRWIPVTERLPEVLQVVNTSDGTYVGSGYVNNVGTWITDGKTDMKSVTHWMPLPLPPKEVE